MPKEMFTCQNNFFLKLKIIPNVFKDMRRKKDNHEGKDNNI